MKRYLITGASRGIGRAIGLRMAGEGATLLLPGRDAVPPAQTCREIERHGNKPVKLLHDLATTRGVDDLIAQVGHEPIDLLVNNAGVAVVKPFIEVTLEEWTQTIGVNLTAAFLLMQHFAPRMRPGSSIVNIL